MADRKVHKVITLEHPVEYGEELISEVTVYRPKGKDMRVFTRISKDDPASQETVMMAFIGSITAMTPSQLDALDYEDWVTVFTTAADFAPSGPETGKA